MPTVELTKDDFEQTIVDNDLVLVDFWAEWCGPCRSFAPVFEDASNEHTDVVFAKVDTEAEQELAQYFEIRSIPTLMVFKEKVRIFSQPGALPGSALQDLINQAKDLDMAPIHDEIAKNHDHEGEAAHEDHDHG